MFFVIFMCFVSFFHCWATVSYFVPCCPVILTNERDNNNNNKDNIIPASDDKGLDRNVKQLMQFSVVLHELCDSCLVVSPVLKV